MASASRTKRKIEHPYITCKKGMCGGKPTISGTRIKVSQIVIYYEKMGYSPDDIVRALPHLTLSQVHYALSFYYENIHMIDDQIAEEREIIDKLKQDFISVLDRKQPP